MALLAGEREHAHLARLVVAQQRRGEANIACTLARGERGGGRPPPLYGMCVILMPVFTPNTSIARCQVLPIPECCRRD